MKFGIASRLPVEDLFVFNNRCERNSANGVHVSSVAGTRMVENVCRFNGAYGLSSVGEYTCDMEMVGNVAERNAQSGVHLNRNNTDQARRARIMGNVCIGNGQCGIELGEPLECLISSNHCVANRSSGIYLNSSTTAYDSASNHVANNYCIENLEHGIHVRNQRELIADGNICQRNGQHGINLERAVDSSVRGNRCLGNGTSAHSTYSNITAYDLSDNVEMAENACRKGSGTNLSKYGVDFDVTTGPGRSNRVFYNDLKNGGSAAVDPDLHVGSSVAATNNKT